MAIQFMGNQKHGLGVCQNENIMARKEARQNQNQSKQLKNGSINMSELNGKADSILMRKQLAKKRAMKVISDAWGGDKKMDMGIEERKDRIQELKLDIKNNRDFIADCNANKAELKESLGIADDSQEQKDLELLEKSQRAMSDPFVELTEEEKERLEELKDQPLTDYQQQCLALDGAIEGKQREIDKAEDEIVGENTAIRSVRLERLKYHKMVDAQKEADEINEAASQEIIGMLIGEAKDHIDETRKEEQEEAKKKAEEEEEQEEKIEERREEREELQELLELKREESAELKAAEAEQRKNAREQADLLMSAEENAIDPSSGASLAQLEIKDMLQKMKLLEEDLKGAKVDNTI